MTVNRHQPFARTTDFVIITRDRRNQVQIERVAHRFGCVVDHRAGQAGNGAASGNHKIDVQTGTALSVDAAR